ncbi:ATP-binding cassette domain-containing protein [Candidatus Pelagibacter sp.]|nr:ATP-binding cassette domain-containing protein [Candidatus Pelagibacter sp.]
MIKKTFSIFDLKTKIEAISLFVLNIISALLDVISIGSIPVFLYYILEPEKLISKIPFEKVQIFIGDFISSNSDTENLYIILLGLVLLFVIKNIFIFLVTVYQFLFSRKIRARYTSKLFNIYINKRYDFFLEKDPANFINNLDSVHIIPSVIIISLGIIKEISIIFSLIFLIAFTNLNIAILLTFIVLFAYFLFRFKLGDILRSQGKKSYHYQENRYALISEFFGSIIDIKTLNKENFFSKIFSNFIWKFETTVTISKILNSIVRPFIEIIGILIMVSFIVYLTYLGKSFSEIIPAISFLALSFIRIIPSATTLISYLNSYKFEENKLDYLINRFENDKIIQQKNFVTPVKKHFFENSLELKNIDFTFKNSQKRIITNLSLKINKGDQLAIIGKTGSGKSTLVNLICNLLKFSKGQIILDNELIINADEDYRVENLYYVRQDVYLLNASVKNNIAFGVEDNDIDEELIKDCLKKVGLNHYIDKLDETIGNRGTKISGGEKQLLSLARALYNKPKFLILDEPTSNLDYKNEKNYFDIIKKLKVTTIIVAHRINTLEYCNKIILLKDGSIIDQGNLENFNKKYDNLNSYLG